MELEDLSPTDASNVTQFPENQAPSTVNDGARALQGMIARYVQDLNTSVEATLSGSVIQVTANRVSISMTGTTSNYRANLMQTWTMGSVPNTGPASLNIDGIGPISLRDNRGVSLSSSILLAGTRCLAVKDGTNDYFRLLWPDGDASTLSNLGTAGQVLAVNSGATAGEWVDKTAQATGQATTSGTSFTFSSIPSWVKKITIIFNGVSLSGTDDLFIQIGDSGGVETTGYVASSLRASENAVSRASSTTSAFIVRVQNAGGTVNGHMTLTLVDTGSTAWISSHSVMTDTENASFGGGSKTLSGTLDRVVITRGGTNTFDAGSLNIIYE